MGSLLHFFLVTQQVGENGSTLLSSVEGSSMKSFVTPDKSWELEKYLYAVESEKLRHEREENRGVWVREC